MERVFKRVVTVEFSSMLHLFINFNCWPRDGTSICYEISMRAVADDEDEGLVPVKAV